MRHPTQGSIPAYNKRDPTLHWTLSCLQNKLEGILRHIWDGDIQTWYHINNKKRSIFLTPGIVSPLESLCKSMFVSHHEIKSSQNFTGVNAKSEDCSRTHSNCHCKIVPQCFSVFLIWQIAGCFFFCENIFKSSKICEINKQTNK